MTKGAPYRWLDPTGHRPNRSTTTFGRVAVFIVIPLFILAACTGTRPILLDPDRLPTDGLLQRKARIEAILIDGSVHEGEFLGNTDSLLYIQDRRTAITLSLDSVAYVNYLYPLAETNKYRHRGFIRGLALGITDAALLTLIYGSADNDVNRNSLFIATAITSAIPLTVYLTLETGNKGKELDEKGIADFQGLAARAKSRKGAAKAAPPDTTHIETPLDSADVAPIQ